MITLYLMGKKGLTVLKSVLLYKDFIAQVISAKDTNVQNDYFQDIKDVCFEHAIPFYERVDNFTVNTSYTIAISWRWLIPPTKDNKLIVLHDSLLPRYRGFAPLVSMLINRESHIGVTALFASEDYDCGDIIMQKSISVKYPIRIADAIKSISVLYCEIVKDIMLKIINKVKISSTPQKNDATYSLWRNDDDYLIDWTKDASYIQQFIYSVGYPYKGAVTSYDEVYRIFDCETLHDVIIENRTPGKIIFMKDGCPVVVCGTGLLKITKMETENGQSCIPFKQFRVKFK